MKHLLVLQYIGADAAPMVHAIRRIFGHSEAVRREFSRRPWVAEVGPGFVRSFLRGAVDYSEATPGGRGVTYSYVLDSSRVYEVKEWTTWGTSRRYFLRWGESRQELTRSEVLAWLSSRGAPASTS